MVMLKETNLDFKTNIIKEKVLTILIPFIICFMSVTRNGNLNMLYFFSFGVFAILLFKKRINIKKIVFYFIPFIIILFLTLFFSKYFNDIVKSIIYIGKLFLCVNLFVVSKDLKCEKNFLYKIIDNLTIIIFILTIIAIFTKNEYLWRFNDTINSFSTTRLQLFFQEPSELSEVCGFLLIINFFRFRKYKKNILTTIMTIIPLILSAGLSGIVYSFLSIEILILLTEFSFLSKGKISKLFLLNLVMIIIVFAIFMSGNSNIAKRIIAVLSGEDGSFNYRYIRANDALQYILLDTNGIGVGLGNLRTDKVETLLENFDLKSFSNSYLFFIAEGGIVAIAYLLSLIGLGIKNVLFSNINYYEKCLRACLVFFIVIIQVTGGYFTDPFLWLITGISFGVKIKI